FFQAEDGIRDLHVTGVQTCALPILGYVQINAAAGQQRPKQAGPSAAPPATPRAGAAQTRHSGAIPPATPAPAVPATDAGRHPAEIGRASGRERGVISAAPLLTSAYE